VKDKIVACIAAVVGTAIFTLAAMLAIIRGTILAVSISDLPLRVLATGADLILGTVLLVGCIYLATHLAVRILGVGDTEFPPLPELSIGDAAQLDDRHFVDPAKN
jgi:hypothetical protein